jgi:hypothetical protein
MIAARLSAVVVVAALLVAAVAGTAIVTKCVDNFCKVGCNSTTLKTNRCISYSGQFHTPFANLQPSAGPGWALQLNIFANASDCSGKPFSTQAPACDILVIEDNGAAYWSGCANASATTAAVYNSHCGFSGGNCQVQTKLTVGECATVPNYGGRVQLVGVLDTSATLTIDTYSAEWKCTDSEGVRSFNTVACGSCNTNWAGAGSTLWAC